MLDNYHNTIAITGASGLLGRHLCDMYRRKGWRVNALVRDISKYPFMEKGINVYKCDLPDTMDLKSIENAVILIHCAYMTRFTSKEDAKRANEEGMLKVYKAAQNAGVKKFVFISSRAAHPDAKSYYAQSKYRLESMLDMSRDLIIRPGLILASDGGLFSRIVNLVQRLPVIPVFGRGDQKIKTVHIDDLCNAIERALEDRLCGVISVSEMEDITMKDLLKLVLSQVERKKLLISVPGTPFILLLQFMELIGLKLPVSSENLRGLLSTGSKDLKSINNYVPIGMHIRSTQESIKHLISK